MSQNQKKIWIIGASSGIGKAVAGKFASEGWKVAVSARRKGIINKMRKKKNIFSYPLDITKKNSIKVLFKKILHDFTNIDACLFCFGIYNRKAEKKINPINIKKTIDVNFIGVVNCIKVIEKYFKKKKEGIIAIISSVSAYRGVPNSFGYGPSKAALTNFVESIYLEFKKYNIQIKLISPSFIKTPMTKKNELFPTFIKSPKFAANKIFENFKNKELFEIHFPKETTFFLKILRIIPYKIYFFLIEKLLKKNLF